MTQDYKEFYGSHVMQMPKLLTEGYVPASTAEIMKRRVNNEDFFVYNWFNTSDLMASKKNVDFKFVLTVDNKNQITDKGREALELIHYDNKNLFEGYIDLGGQYDSLEGIEVSRKDLGKVQEMLTKGEALDSKVWRILARHPDEVPAEFAEGDKLLEEYVDWVQSKTNDPKNMQLHIISQSNKEKLRAWYVHNRLEGKSYAAARDLLDGGGGRFVGLETKNTL